MKYMGIVGLAMATSKQCWRTAMLTGPEHQVGEGRHFLSKALQILAPPLLLTLTFGQCLPPNNDNIRWARNSEWHNLVRAELLVSRFSWKPQTESAKQWAQCVSYSSRGESERQRQNGVVSPDCFIFEYQMGRIRTSCLENKDPLTFLNMERKWSKLFLVNYPYFFF